MLLNAKTHTQVLDALQGSAENARGDRGLSGATPEETVQSIICRVLEILPRAATRSTTTLFRQARAICVQPIWYTPPIVLGARSRACELAGYIQCVALNQLRATFCALHNLLPLPPHVHAVHQLVSTLFRDELLVTYKNRFRAPNDVITPFLHHAVAIMPASLNPATKQV